jgi:hypothetical protein
MEEKKKQEDREKYMMSSFIICTPREMLQDSANE